MSYHESDPDLLSSSDELAASRQYLNKLIKLFPKMDIMNSNHGSLPYRKAKTAGIPKSYMKELKEVYKAPKTWKWHDRLTITMSNGQKLKTGHMFQTNELLAAQKKGMCIAQAHYHTIFGVRYSATSEKLIWGANVGCGLDDESLAFHYNKVFKDKPILGALIVKNGHPMPIPMMLDSKGKFTGKL